jgi:hypothetical protein
MMKSDNTGQTKSTEDLPDYYPFKELEKDLEERLHSNKLTFSINY